MIFWGISSLEQLLGWVDQCRCSGVSAALRLVPFNRPHRCDQYCVLGRTKGRDGQFRFCSQKIWKNEILVLWIFSFHNTTLDLFGSLRLWFFCPLSLSWIQSLRPRVGAHLDLICKAGKRVEMKSCKWLGIFQWLHVFRMVPSNNKVLHGVAVWPRSLLMQSLRLDVVLNCAGFLSLQFGSP